MISEKGEERRGEGRRGEARRGKNMGTIKAKWDFFKEPSSKEQEKAR